MTFPLDPVERELRDVLAAIVDGHGSNVERKHVDLKEDRSRRDAHGALGSGDPRDDHAAQHLAGASACMANTDGGGALIVGVGDDGTPLGTQLDAEWLRQRIYELTERRLTADIRSTEIDGVRLLLVRVPQAIEPIRYRGRIAWRVGDRCVEIDASTWHARRLERDQFDWSAQPSTLPYRAARPEALALARRYLRQSQEERAHALAAATDSDLLHRLHAVTPDGLLTNAAALLFVGRGEPALDYMRRRFRGGDTQRRLRESGMPVLEEFARVEDAADLANEEQALRTGFVIGKLRELPPSAVREAIVNGIVHRDWLAATPTVIEHIGRALVVSSPGGFVGGVAPDNIITHPSQARNRALAELCGALRLAEREGLGFDRMVADMVALGYPEPTIAEIPGPYVRLTLIGEPFDEAWVRFLGRMSHDGVRNDVSALLLLRHLVGHGWIDAARVGPLLQLDASETLLAIHRLAQVRVDDAPAIDLVPGVPESEPPAWRLSASTRRALADEDAEAGNRRPPPSRSVVALDWAQSRGRISTTELAGVVGAHPTNVSGVLRRLEEDGLLRPSRQTRTGRGFYYLPVRDGRTAPDNRDEESR